MFACNLQQFPQNSNSAPQQMKLKSNPKGLPPSMGSRLSGCLQESELEKGNRANHFPPPPERSTQTEESLQNGSAPLGFHTQMH